tara:strand:+ start:15138 stop:17282 length:2145 start_codon:yes stop_codon:yes gene_type:complete
MKTINLVKTLSFTIFFLSIFNVNAQDQFEARIWATISDPSDVPFINAQGQLYSNDFELNQAILELGINSVTQAFPSARKTSLINVFELRSDRIDEVEFYARLVNNVSALSKVEYAPKYEILATPDDYVDTGHHYAIGLINAQDAWDFTTGSPDVTIAISDQSADVSHNELQDQVIFAAQGNTVSSTHGTAVSIIAAGGTNNDILQSHIGYNSTLAIYNMNYNAILEASYAGYKVINMSWASGCQFSAYVQDIINTAYDNGSFLVAAAGNGSTCGGAENMVYPASYENVFSVTSIGSSDNHERIIGDPSSTHQHNTAVDISAPGYNVYVSPAPGMNLISSGTSYATPLVSGTVALMLAVNPCLTNENIEYILKSSSVFIDDINPEYAGLIGEGRLDAGAAVEMASNFNALAINADILVACDNFYGGQINLEIMGGNAPYQAIWDNGAEGLNVIFPAGQYNVSIYDTMGCSLDTTFVIEESTPVIIEEAIQHVGCHGQNTGAIDITILQGAPSFLYEWSHGAETEDIENLEAGTYRLALTDSNGCISYSSYEVLQSEEIQAYVEIEDPMMDATSININLTVEGGTAPYTYSWNTGDISEDLFNVSEGFYEVIITDINGCSKEAHANVYSFDLAHANELSSKSVKVYPNPASEPATITWTMNDFNTLTILNAGGKTIDYMDIAMQNSFQTERLKPGIYFINLSSQNQYTTTRKLVVQ